MNKIKLVLSALGVFAVVGSALAYKPMLARDLLICPNGICILPAQSYSTIPGTPVPNPGNLYQGPLNSRCTGANPPCIIYPVSAPAFLNN